MVKKASLNLSQVVQNHRFGLWILLILLTAIILLFPVRLHQEYHAVQSTYVFGDKLLLFGILYCVWLAILLLLLFSKGKNNEWQRVALVCIFALVFFGFWIMNTPDGGNWDEVWNMGHVKYLQETGRISLDLSRLGYFQFPTVHLIGFSLSETWGLGIFETRILYLVFSGMLFAALSYLLFMKLLKSPYLASLAVLLMLQGSLVSSKHQAFTPENPVFLLLIALLVLLVRRENRPLGTTPEALIMIILLAGFTISYQPTPAAFIFILAGIYLLQKVAKKSVVRSSTIVLCLTMFLAWGMFWSTGMFTDMALLLPTFVASFRDPFAGLLTVPGTVAPALGAGVPLWARATKYFWMALVYVFGGILAIWNLVKVKKLDSIGVMVTGALLGAIIFSIIAYLAFPAGWLVFARILKYAPLFTIPIMLTFLSGFSRHNEPSQENTILDDRGEGFNSNGFRRSLANCEGWFRRHAFSLLIILLFVSSLPTFLVHHSAISTGSTYSYEHSGGEFLESTYGYETEVNLFSSVIPLSIYTYYVPHTHYYSILAPEEPEKWQKTGEEDLWLEYNRLVDGFEYPVRGNAVFVLSERFRIPSYRPPLFEPTDPRWVELVNRLAEHNKIYDNGHIEIYEYLAK